ncbi:hypothetical protein [Mesorhizobium sp. BH1-1-4]|uniref:hypothetical protein n=1 Tax=Mesorhizobium sp. BH1-1-4 TaxID=2876662 RepID=UPI001CD1368F|nr:hypothetical protein [Mesorhizobium sp. BH1-1-4]MBZ9992803.1 hypothetical protein [Mesorhizobium sp. BH1-1-4]
MTTDRYDARWEEDGSWTMFDVFTGQPYERGALVLIGMPFLQADDITRLLNADRGRRTLRDASSDGRIGSKGR